MSYNLLNPVQIIPNGDMSGNITSNAVELKNQDNMGIQFHWTGSPVGTFSVQISMDHRADINGNVIVPGNWVTLPVSPVIAASGSADDAYVDLNQLSAPYIRVIYTRSSGTGVLTLWVNAKGV